MADPRLPDDATPVFWSAHEATDVLILAELPLGFAATSTSDLPKPSAERLAEDGRHRLIHGQPVQLWLLADRSADTPLGQRLIQREHHAERIATAMAFWRRTRGHGDTPSTSPTPQRRTRLILGLRALDGRTEGASYREIASVLFGPENVPAGRAWKTHDLRSRTLRLVSDATALMRGGYRKLLR